MEGWELEEDRCRSSVFCGRKGRALVGECLRQCFWKCEYTSAPACGEHVGGPVSATASGRIEVSAPRELHGREPVEDHHGGAAVGAVPGGRSFRMGAGWRAIVGQQLPAEREAARAESICKKTKIPDSDEPFRQHMQEKA